MEDSNETGGLRRGATTLAAAVFVAVMPAKLQLAVAWCRDDTKSPPPKLIGIGQLFWQALYRRGMASTARSREPARARPVINRLDRTTRKEMPMELGDQNIGAPRGVGHYRDGAAAERFARAYAAAFAALPPVHARDITSDFGRTRLYQFGDGTGTPLVLLPGWGASTPMWAPHLDDLLALGRPLFAIDPIGQAGGSRQTGRLRTTDEQVAWLDELLAELCPIGAHVIGASAGGSLALQTAAGSPQRFRSLTVIDPPSVFAPLSTRFMALGIGSAIPILPMWVRRRLLDAIAGTGRSDPGDPITQLGTSAARDFQARLPPPSRLCEHKLRALEAPVLALIGGATRVHDPARAADRARVLPRGRVEVWNGAGHVLNAADPGRFVAAVRNHIFGSASSFGDCSPN